MATRADLAASLKAGAREGTYQRSRTRAALLMLQGALSVILLVGAGLFVQSLGNVRAMRMGYDAGAGANGRANLRGMQLPDSERVRLGRRLLEAAQAIPGVAHAALGEQRAVLEHLQPGPVCDRHRFGRPKREVHRCRPPRPDYFATMDTRIIRGRPFTAAERDSTPRGRGGQ